MVAINAYGKFKTYVSNPANLFDRSEDLLKAMQQLAQPINEMMNIFRFPVNRMTQTSRMLEKMPVRPRNDWKLQGREFSIVFECLYSMLTVAQFGSIGTPYAFKINTKNGRIGENPDSCENKKTNETIRNGFMVRRRSNSCNFSIIVGCGCVQSVWDFEQAVHAFEYLL